jgi:RNA polymerase sigma factor (sigma-70 family)
MQPYTNSFIKECCKGNKAYQKQLFESLYNSMFRLCTRYVKQYADAEDCMMKGFMKMFQHMDGFVYEDENSFERWVKQIMVNECLMFLRKKHKALLFPEESLPQVPINAEILMQLDAEALNSLILQLPMGYRTVFNLYVVEGYDHREIASMLNINENTSRSQLMKAKSKLKAMVEQKTMSYENAGR